VSHPRYCLNHRLQVNTRETPTNLPLRLGATKAISNIQVSDQHRQKGGLLAGLEEWTTRGRSTFSDPQAIKKPGAAKPGRIIPPATVCSLRGFQPHCEGVGRAVERACGAEPWVVGVPVRKNVDQMRHGRVCWMGASDMVAALVCARHVFFADFLQPSAAAVASRVSVRV